MINEALARPFPKNLFHDLGTDENVEQSEDFFASLMYVLRCVADARNAQSIILRYKNGKTFEEIGDALGITKQRAQSLIQSVLDKITGDYVFMLTKGVKKYYDDLFMSRIENLDSVLEESERESLKRDSFAEGYQTGYDDARKGMKGNTVSMDTLDSISIDSLSLSVRTYNALNRNGIKNLGDVVNLGDNILNLRTFGKKCFDELASILTSYGVRVVSTFPFSCNKFEWSAQNE